VAVTSVVLSEATRDELREELRRRLNRLPTPRAGITQDDLLAAYDLVKKMAATVADEARGGDEQEWAPTYSAAFRLVYGMTPDEWLAELRR
jgi:hypothetical protein